jgi:hypothetical protein
MKDTRYYINKCDELISTINFYLRKSKNTIKNQQDITLNNFLKELEEDD